MKTTLQEHATIMAALNFYQMHKQGDPEHRDQQIDYIATESGEFPALDHDQIDDLMERYNTVDTPDPALPETLNEGLVNHLICGDPQHMRGDEILRLDQQVSLCLNSGMSNAQVSRIICRKVNELSKPEPDPALHLSLGDVRSAHDTLNQILPKSFEDGDVEAFFDQPLPDILSNVCNLLSNILARHGVSQ